MAEQAAGNLGEQRVFLLPIDLNDLETPMFALWTRSQIVEIMEPSAVSWRSSADHFVRGMCSYGVDNFPVLDLPALCANSSVEENRLPKQVIVVRTGEINTNRSFKVAFSTLSPVRSIKLSSALLSMKNNQNELPVVFTNHTVIRGFFVHPQLHIALLDVKAIEKIARGTMA